MLCITYTSILYACWLHGLTNSPISASMGVMCILAEVAGEWSCVEGHRLLDFSCHMAVEQYGFLDSAITFIITSNNMLIGQISSSQTKNNRIEKHIMNLIMFYGNAKIQWGERRLTPFRLDSNSFNSVSNPVRTPERWANAYRGVTVKNINVVSKITVALLLCNFVRLMCIAVLHCLWRSFFRCSRNISFQSSLLGRLIVWRFDLIPCVMCMNWIFAHIICYSSPARFFAADENVGRVL